ncbi:hypothetical protein V6255_05865 [Psychromonas arctica]|uniref:Uncharacterized protein n=1 Tax=Psychromonas arctica TaxID=168275 RepID=A0ABU9H9U4_9GAMM
MTDGGILFRGDDIPGEASFREFARSFNFPLLNYEFGSTPRTELSNGVYTTTEYPAHQIIPLNNKQAYTTNWPMKIGFIVLLLQRQRGNSDREGSLTYSQLIKRTTHVAQSLVGQDVSSDSAIAVYQQRTVDLLVFQDW